MKLRICRLLAIAICVFGCFGSVRTLAQNAYITDANPNSNSVSVIDAATNTVTATIAVGSSPIGVAVSPAGNKVYVANGGSNTMSVIAAATNKVTATIPVGSAPEGVAVSPDGTKVYVTNEVDNSVSVIDTATNTVTATIAVGSQPFGVAVTPDGSKVYVTIIGFRFTGNTVSVIDTATNKVTARITVGFSPSGVAVNPDGSTVYVATTDLVAPVNTVSVIAVASEMVTTTIILGTPRNGASSPSGVAVSPDGSKVYVTNGGFNTVSVIDTVTNTVIATIPVGLFPLGVAVSPDGSKVYVTNGGFNSVSVIDTATDAVTTITDSSFNVPFVFGDFIGPPPKFAGTPGFSNCHGQSVSALAKQYGGLNAASAALGFASVNALQDAIENYCEA
jgi:YVTN family beta-propeller protein